MSGVTPSICFGDRVSICCERANSFLSSSGVADARLLLSEPSQIGRPALNFERCIFSIEKAKTWGISTTSSVTADSYAPEPLMFGNTVQLRHTYSGHFVCVTRHRRVESKGALHVALEHLCAENAQASVFRVLPRYKIRQEGERVNAGDHMVLFNEFLRVQLSLDSSTEEIIGSGTVESFSFLVFETSDLRASSSIRLQSSILLFHKEQESFVQLDRGLTTDIAPANLVLMHPHIRDSTYNIASLDFSANALWVVESVQGTEGGFVVPNEAYRIKHSATSKYLGASVTQRDQLVVVDHPLDGDGTLWTFVPCDAVDRHVQSSSTFFRIQNLVTGSWIHTSAPLTAETLSVTESHTEKSVSRYAASERSAHYTGQFSTVTKRDHLGSVNGLVGLVERPAYVDVFCAVTAPESAELSIHRVLGYKRLMKQFLEVVQQTQSVSSLAECSLLGKVRRCLAELIPFCAGGWKAQAQTVSESHARMPIAANQRMLLDQGMEHFVITALEKVVSLSGWSEWPHVVVVISQLFQFLTAMIADNLAGCDSVYLSLDRLLAHLAHSPIACGLFSRVSRVKVFETSLLIRILDIVIPLLANDEAYFILLQELCSGGGIPHKPSQKLIFEALLNSDAMPKILMTSDSLLVACPTLREEPVPVHTLDDSCDVGRFCAGAWKLLGCCTVGSPYPPLSWVEVDHIAPLLESVRQEKLRRAVISVVRSVFLSDVDPHDAQHPQLWSWKYKLVDQSEERHITQIQSLVMRDTLSMLHSLVGEFHESPEQNDLFNEVLLLWNSIAISQTYSDEHGADLAVFLDEFFKAVPSAPRSSGVDDQVGVTQSIVHVLNLLQTLLGHHASKASQEVRHIIRPQLHEEADDDTEALAAEIRSRATSELFCRKDWLQHMINFASGSNPLVSSSALKCIFNILAPSRLALHHVESSVVFSEGFEDALGCLLDVAQEAARVRFSLSSPASIFEALLVELLEMTKGFSQDLATTLDAQNVLHFAGLHGGICQYLDHAQRASAGRMMGNIVDVGMKLLSFMSNRNADVAEDMVQNLSTLTQLSTLCQSSPHYFAVLGTSFCAAGGQTTVDVTKLVNDIFSGDVLNEVALQVVMDALRCRSEQIRANTREAAVGAMSMISFDLVPAGCKTMLLEIVCECVAEDTRDAISRSFTISDVLSILPTARDLIASSAGSSVYKTFEVCVRCVTQLCLHEGCSLLVDEAEQIKRLIADAVLEVSTTQFLQTLPPVVFECLAQLMLLGEHRPMFVTCIRMIASHILNHCETSVNTKFQIEAKEHLLHFFERVESYILPDSLPNIAVVRRRLQRIASHSERSEMNTSASSISGHWTKIRRELAERLREPSADDLKPLIDLMQVSAPEAKSIVSMFVKHLRYSDLDSWVSVSILLCLRYVLCEAEAASERQQLATQNLLNACCATPLLSTLLEKPDVDVVRQAVKFGICLLEGGNKQCQDALLTYFKTHDEKFFFTIRMYLKLAQAEISSQSPSADPDSEAKDGSYSALAQDLCRLLQLLCEGHHFEFQNYVRHQNDNFNTYNMCVLVMELLHNVVLHLDSATMHIAIQSLNTLTEFCQGPCQMNQAAIVNGCNVVPEVNRILTMKYDTDRFSEETVMEMKQAAIVLLLSLLEGSQDSAIPNLILTSIDTGALHMLVEQVWAEAFGDEKGKEPLDKEEQDELLQLGFNIFILAKILTTQGDKAKSDNLIAVLMDTAGYEYFNSSICNIEIWRDDDPESLRLETVYFRKPEICRLREETKEAVMNEVDRSSVASKHSGFCKYADDLIFEMEFQFQIEEAAGSINKVLRILTFNLAKCRPRPVEDLLLLLALFSNLMVISGFTDRQGPIDWPAAVAFFVVGILECLCSLYLVAVRMILKIPRLAHRSLKKGESDPFLSIKSWREKFSHVATYERIWKVLIESYTMSFLVFALASFCSVLFSPFFNTVLLAMVTFKAPLLANIVNAITMNGRQLLLTAFLGVISVYFFTVIGYLFFHEHFERSEGGGSNCETLLQCFFYSFGQGVRGGGGIGEELKANMWENNDFFRREVYDTLFFVIVAVIVMNIVFALIVDTFAELRDERKKIEDDMRTTCFVCGIDAATFDREGEGFGPHTKGPHNVWQFLYFLHHLRRKEVCEYTGQESYVAAKVNAQNLSFFPVNRSKSLIKATRSEEKDDEPQSQQAAVTPIGVTEAMKKVLRDTIEEQFKAIRASQSTGQGAASSASSAPQTTNAVAQQRSTNLWAKARTQRGSIVKSFGQGARQAEAEEEEVSLASCIQVVSGARSTVASMKAQLDRKERL